jgi:hypothetical protein
MKCKRAISGIKFGMDTKENIFLCSTPKPCPRKYEGFKCKNPEFETIIKDCPMKTGSGEPDGKGGIIRTVPKNCRMKGCFSEAPMSEDKMKVCQAYKEMTENEKQN